MQILPLLLLAISPIQLDGLLGDWADGVTLQEDAQFVYKRIDLPSESCLQQLPEQKVVQIGEYEVYFSPDGKGYGVSCKKGSQWISPYEAGVVFAPTTASTSFELRVNKATGTYPFSFEKQGDLRVVSWNVQFGALLKDKARGGRILKALQPDVLLIQELDGEDTCSELESFLHDTLGGSWLVETSNSNGEKRSERLKSAIATSADSMACFTVGKTPLKAIGASISFSNKPINFISLHLRCCGGPTSDAEKQRVSEATDIRKTIDSMQSPRFVIAGDWNLVGTTAPLLTVTKNDFAVVQAYQPDGRVHATWSDETSSFTPGRLDLMLYSPLSLEVARSFVLDTSDLDSDTLIAQELLGEDTALLSDHLPLVADFHVLK